MYHLLQRFYKKIIQFFIQIYILQMYITLFSLPCFIWWGLGISKAAIFGNILFLPFLWSFICLSIIYTLFLFLHIPTSICSWGLHYISIIWNFIIAQGQTNWLIGFHAYMFIPSIIAIISVYTILQIYKLSYIKKAGILSSALICLLLCNKIFQPNLKVYTLSYRKGYAQIIAIHKKLYFIDYNLCNRVTNIEDWLQYTLLPTCFSEFGNHSFQSIKLSRNIPQWKQKKLHHLFKLYFPIKNGVFA